MLTENAIEILKARYLLKHGNGKVSETPNQLFQRVANHVASVESGNISKWASTFYNVLAKLEFLPNSPTLMNAGLDNGQLSACFVLPVEDSLRDIFETLKNAALIHQSGGGTGYNFSKLRPKDDLISSSGGVSSGPAAFIKLYDASTEQVKQGGKRRGANMAILNVDHPDIEEFILLKSNGRSLQNFNISVGITDFFMRAVDKKGDWNLINPRTKKTQKTVKAHKIWEKIAQAAWSTGDPGLIFLDTVNKYNPNPDQGAIQSTNPCGEVPLLDYESCTLGSLNLSKMLKKHKSEIVVDWEKLERIIHIAIRFLDNVITVNYFPTEHSRNATIKNRKVGLGVMGWAEMLIALNIPYASDDAVRLGEQLMQFIQAKSYEASKKLSSERGNFPSWKNSIYHPDKPMRNATCNSIAPTGSISVIANTSYSIEPLYALVYNRVGILEDVTQMEVNTLFVNTMRQLGCWNSEVKDAVLKSGSIGHIDSIPKKTRKLFETSLEIPWRYHLLHQRAFQLFTDNAVSKTINLPNTISRKEVSEIYFSAWKMGLKGITVYRDGSKPNQVLQRCHFSVDTKLNC